MNELNAIRHLEQEKGDLEAKREEDMQERRKRARNYSRYVQVEERLATANDVFTRKQAENNSRVATTWGSSASYVAVISLIGIAEWLINYDTFMSFLQVPAFAAGATIILGVLLAFAAHAHGTLLKQAAFLFSAHCEPRERSSSWRLLAFGTFCLLPVLVAAGGSRYAAVTRALALNPHFNILGADAVIERNPARDVLLSLLANVAAWAVGVFIAYTAHDPDPEYMGATVDLHRARRRFNRLSAPVARDLESIRARYTKQIKELENRTRSHSESVQQERSLLAQVDDRERGILAQLSEAGRQNAELYRILESAEFSATFRRPIACARSLRATAP